MINENNIGHFFTDERGQIWQLVAYTDQPTAKLVKVGTVEERFGVVSSMNLSKFELVPADVQSHLNQLVTQSKEKPVK